MQAWIISLNPNKPEAVKLAEVLAANGLEAKIIPAVDGRNAMPTLCADEQLDQRQALRNRRAPLTSSEVGCYLSHLRAIRKAYEMQLRHIAIFEDDVVAEDHLADLFKAIESLDNNAHLVRLMSLKRRKRKVTSQLTDHYQLIRPIRGALGTQGYVLNREGMRRILEFGYTISMPIDKLYDSFFLFGLKCFSVEPHAIHEVMHTSTISKNETGLDNRFWITIGWRLNKLYRSIRRHSHRLKHRSEFEPASAPPAGVGKSQRLR